MGAISLPTRFYELHPSLYIFSHGKSFEARANIEKTKKSQHRADSFVIYPIKILYHRGGRGMTPEQVKEKLEGVKWISKEIKGLYLKLEALEGGNRKANTKP